MYSIGPMCVINRTTMEPPSHRECAEFAAEACPFLLRPRMRRLPFEADEERHVAGTMIERNPGCVCLYETSEATKFSDGKGGWLIRLGPPDRVDWWAEGRRATRAEIQASIDSGHPLLLDIAMKDGQDAVEELGRLTLAAFKPLAGGVGYPHRKSFPRIRIVGRKCGLGQAKRILERQWGRACPALVGPRSRPCWARW